MLPNGRNWDDASLGQTLTDSFPCWELYSYWLLHFTFLWDLFSCSTCQWFLSVLGFLFVVSWWNLLLFFSVSFFCTFLLVAPLRPFHLIKEVNMFQLIMGKPLAVALKLESLLINPNVSVGCIRCVGGAEVPYLIQSLRLPENLLIIKYGQFVDVMFL